MSELYPFRTSKGVTKYIRETLSSFGYPDAQVEAVFTGTALRIFYVAHGKLREAILDCSGIRYLNRLDVDDAVESIKSYLV